MVLGIYSFTFLAYLKKLNVCRVIIINPNIFMRCLLQGKIEGTKTPLGELFQTYKMFTIELMANRCRDVRYQFYTCVCVWIMLIVLCSHISTISVLFYLILMPSFDGGELE